MQVYWDVFLPAEFAEASSPDSGESMQRLGGFGYGHHVAVPNVAVESKIPKMPGKC